VGESLGGAVTRQLSRSCPTSELSGASAGGPRRLPWGSTRAPRAWFTLHSGRLRPLGILGVPHVAVKVRAVASTVAVVHNDAVTVPQGAVLVVPVARRPPLPIPPLPPPLPHRQLFSQRHQLVRLCTTLPLQHGILHSVIRQQHVVQVTAASPPPVRPQTQAAAPRPQHCLRCPPGWPPGTWRALGPLAPISRPLARAQPLPPPPPATPAALLARLPRLVPGRAQCPAVGYPCPGRCAPLPAVHLRAAPPSGAHPQGARLPQAAPGRTAQVPRAGWRYTP